MLCRASKVWSVLHKSLDPSLPFECHHLCYEKVYEGVDDVKPAWIPSKDTIQETNMKKYGIESYQSFYKWSVDKDSRDHFWMESSKNTEVAWETEPTTALDIVSNGGVAQAQYFPGGRLNISDSCFNKRDPLDPALVFSVESNARSIGTMSFQTLNALSNQVFNGITTKLNLEPGDAIGLCMPMTPESVAIYLGIVKAGCAVVSIADSFSSEEIATRCRRGMAKAIFTQDVVVRGSRFLPLLERLQLVVRI
jgi:acetyl-CoA synthetase